MLKFQNEHLLILEREYVSLIFIILHKLLLFTLSPIIKKNNNKQRTRLALESKIWVWTKHHHPFWRDCWPLFFKILSLDLLYLKNGGNNGFPQRVSMGCEVSMHSPEIRETLTSWQLPGWGTATQTHYVQSVSTQVSEKHFRPMRNNFNKQKVSSMTFTEKSPFPLKGQFESQIH